MSNEKGQLAIDINRFFEFSLKPQQAITKLFSREFALVVIYNVMPGKLGIDFAVTLRRYFSEAVVFEVVKRKDAKSSEKLGVIFKLILSF